MILYHAKLNLNSHIFDVYNKKISLVDVMNNVERHFKEGIMYTKKVSRLNPETNELIEVEEEYKLRDVFNIGKREIVGRIGRESLVYVNQENSQKELIRKPIENIEVIDFYLDLDKEVVVFNTRVRFKFKQFVEAFENILNLSQQKGKRFEFRVALITDHLDFNDIKAELSKIKKIKSLEISIIPPNPDNDLLDEFENDMEDYLRELEVANLTKQVMSFESANSRGLNVDSEFLDRKIREAAVLHSKVSPEMAVNKGYVKIKAVNNKGRVFNTETKSLYTKEVSLSNNASIMDFAEVCKRELIS